MPRTLNLSKYLKGSLHKFTQLTTCTQVMMMMMMMNISRPKQKKHLSFYSFILLYAPRVPCEQSHSRVCTISKYMQTPPPPTQLEILGFISHHIIYVILCDPEGHSPSSTHTPTHPKQKGKRRKKKKKKMLCRCSCSIIF